MGFAQEVSPAQKVCDMPSRALSPLTLGLPYGPKEEIKRSAISETVKTMVQWLLEKLKDAFIAILAGAHGLYEINTRLRSDESLQRAFGRAACADQSVVQQTLNACTEINVLEMQQAMNLIFQAHSKADRHN